MTTRALSVACTLTLLLAGWGAGGEQPARDGGASEGPTAELAATLKQAEELVEKNPARALQIAIEARTLAHTLGSLAQEAEASFLIADAARAKGDHREAVEAFVQAKALFARLGNEFQVARCLRRLGDLYYFLTDFDTAVSYYLSAREAFSRLAKTGTNPKAALQLAHLHAAIGNVLNGMGEYGEARAAYRSAVQAYSELNYPLGVAGATYNLGLVAQASGDLPQALAHYRQARKAAAELGDPYLESLALSSEGSVHLAQGEVELARELIQRALQLCQDTQRPRGILDNLLKLGKVQLVSGHLGEAAALLEQAVALARKLGDRLLEAEGLQLQGEVAEVSGKPNQALNLYRQATAIRERVRSEESSGRITKLRLAYETREKEQRIALLEANQQFERAFRWGLLATLGLAVALLSVVWGRYRFQVKAERLIAAKNRELELAYQRVNELSRTDDLTGVPNRRAILELLSQEANRVQRNNGVFSVILCDIDDFKRFNDTFGHECGDFILMEIAKRLRAQLRASDTLGRWGGEEFLLVLPDTDLDGARTLADKLRHAVAGKPFSWQGCELAVTATFGVFEASNAGASEAIRQADLAMYRGKRAGKNCVAI